MNVSLITINYPPEIGGAPHLIHELALSLQDRGHDVTVITNFPSYNLEVVPSQYLHGFWMKEVLDGIFVRRIRIPSLPRTSKIFRGFQHFIYGLWLSVFSLFTPKADIELVFSPPLPLPWLICWIGRLRRIPVVVNIQDLFPRQAVELGMLANPTLIQLFEAMERQIYRLAAKVTVHSPGNKEHIVQQGGLPENVHVVYNWVDTDRIRPGKRDNDFAKKHGLENCFVVSYAGTMGWAQDMETIITSAAKLKTEPNIQFLLVGDGVEKEKAVGRSIELGLENILWLPIQPWIVYPQVLAASDISLINLHPELRTPVVPSKLLSIMASARPVVASLPIESDARRIVADARCGICVDAGDGEALADAIQMLASDHSLTKDMGQHGRLYVETHFSRDFCTGQIETILKRAVGEI